MASKFTQLANTPDFDFKVLSNTKCNRLFVLEPNGGLFQYSFTTDSWISFSSLSKPLSELIDNHDDRSLSSSWNGAAINLEQNLIYLCARRPVYMPSSLYEYDGQYPLNSDELKMLFWKIHIGLAGIMIKDKLHIIGGYKHVRFNQDLQKFEVLHIFRESLNLQTIDAHRVVNVKNKILMFGGYCNRKLSDSIHQYDITNNKWTKLTHKMPVAMRSFGCVSILNGQYILIFGGNSQPTSHDDIYIYSVDDKTFKKSDIKCPEKEGYYAISVCDKKKDMLSTFGFVREQWKRCDIDNHLFPPQYLIQLMCKYYQNEDIHLFNFETGQHYKINVFDIIC